MKRETDSIGFLLSEEETKFRRRARCYSPNSRKKMVKLEPSLSEYNVLHISSERITFFFQLEKLIVAFGSRREASPQKKAIIRSKGQFSASLKATNLMQM